MMYGEVVEVMGNDECKKERDENGPQGFYSTRSICAAA
jgi:hypothetical protein